MLKLRKKRRKMDSCRFLIKNITPEILNSKNINFPKKHLKKGEIFYTDKTQLIIIKNGKIKISLYENNNEFILYFLTQNNICLCLEDNVIESIEESSFYIISPDKFPEIFSDPMFCNFVLNAFTKNLIVERSIIKDLVFKNFKQRTIHFLIQTAENIGKKTDKGIEFKIKCNLEELSHFLGTQRQTLSSFLTKMKKNNILLREHNKFIIFDLEKLKKYV